MTVAPTTNSHELRQRLLIKRVNQLAWFTIIYNVIEGVVSMLMGASEDSIALFGFGADSFIEVASAILVLWRFQGQFAGRKLLEIDRERRATAGIGILFLLLALGTIVAAGTQLLKRNHPESTTPGLVVSVVSLSFMFYLWRSKRRLGRQLESATVLKDAECSLACIQLSAVLMAGSLLYRVLPLFWWADSLAAAAIAALIGREGLETWRASRRADFDGGGCGCA